ncbi:hypothetical protein HDV00_012304 [Rhizophlyctis rosea]|nr:hypothetical protein HDV00_012304 [Rhizophlyctis rosea]
MQRTKDNIDTLLPRLQSLQKAGRTLTHFLGFNEPDMTGQAALTPAQAASLWKQYINPLKSSFPNMKIGAPACSNGGGGFQWFKDFLSQCNSGCTFDFIPVHWYGIGLSSFQSHVQQYHDLRPSLPIWVTEYAWTTWSAANPAPLSDVSTFMKQSMDWMDGTSWIERYSWFVPLRTFDDPTIGSNILLQTTSGAVSTLGKQYAA